MQKTWTATLQCQVRQLHAAKHKEHTNGPGKKDTRSVDCFGMAVCRYFMGMGSCSALEECAEAVRCSSAGGDSSGNPGFSSGGNNTCYYPE